MKAHGYGSLEDFRGKALGYLSRDTVYDDRIRVSSQTDLGRCKYCGRCVEACKD